MDFGDQPPTDAFLRKDDLEKPEAFYPLALYFCENCSLVQIGHIVSPMLIFQDRDYVYTTSTNNSSKINFKNLVEKLVERFKLTSEDFAIDVGSNDGTLLSYYLPYGIKILGVDPSSATKFAIARNIPTVVDFFGEKIAADVLKKYGKAKVITATNVFAHVSELHSFVRGVADLLQDDGVFVSESGYLLDLIERLGYDAVYHEHLRFYSLKPLERLFNKFGLEIFDAERIPTHNGSIRVYAAKIGAYPKNKSVEELMALETKFGLYKKETFIHFAEDAKKHGVEFKTLLTDIKKAGKTIVGIGAPAKANTLLHFCKIDSKIIDCILEKSDLKIGLFTPETHIPILSEEILFKEQPDYAIMFSWNLADELIPKLKNSGYNGKFIIPFPKVKII